MRAKHPWIALQKLALENIVNLKVRERARGAFFPEFCLDLAGPGCVGPAFHGSAHGNSNSPALFRRGVSRAKHEGVLLEIRSVGENVIGTMHGP